MTTGLNNKKPVDRTLLVAIDLSRPFNIVDHKILLKDISELSLYGNIKKFLVSYLRGRQTLDEYRGVSCPSSGRYANVDYSLPFSSIYTCPNSPPYPGTLNL